MKTTLPSNTVSVLTIMSILFNITTLYCLGTFAFESGMGAFAIGIIELGLLIVKWIVACFVVAALLRRSTPAKQDSHFTGAFALRYLGFTLVLIALVIALGFFALDNELLKVMLILVPITAQLLAPFLCLITIPHLYLDNGAEQEVV
jgi:hypothetical protein